MAEGSLPSPITIYQHTETLRPYQVFELIVIVSREVDDTAWMTEFPVEFRAPTGKRYMVGGFYFGPARELLPWLTGKEKDAVQGVLSQGGPVHLWKVRFAPSEDGVWECQGELRLKDGAVPVGIRRFRVVPSRTPVRGWLRIDPDNPFRFAFEDGTPFWGVGSQDCEGDGNKNGSVLDSKAVEGPFRLDRAEERPIPPPGAMFARGPAMSPTNGDVYFGKHARAGFNLWRFSPHNCSMSVFSLDHVDWREARMVDELLQYLRKYNFCVYYGIFGFAKVFNDDPDNVQGMEKVKRIVKYSVDRWGAYVDIWELLNEQHAKDQWYEIVAPYLRSIDPYSKPIATSWERPQLSVIDINAPHWYGNENELESDAVTASRIREAKKFGKPIVFGEQGNSRGNQDRTAEGIGGVWDPGSARRMRVRLWSALFNEATIIFWETSYAKDGHFMNIWIGPEERQYVKALQSFSQRLDRKVRPANVELVGPVSKTVRAYGLSSPYSFAAYFHHVACQECQRLRESGQHAEHRWDHLRGEVRGLEVAIPSMPGTTAFWYNPQTGQILASQRITGQDRRLAVPPFDVDLALLVTSGSAPDSDNDGLSNDQDPDDDNDGVPDAKDAFPLEREEWADVDQDRIGDNFDADIDADGQGDDRNNNGTPDYMEQDWDGDGVPNANAIPWDAFPRDPKEWQDTDGDGIGDHADTDDDNDGFSDEEERQRGTSPVDALLFPAEQSPRAINRDRG